MFLFYGTCLLFVLIIAELVFIKISEKHIPWNEIVTNLNSGHIVLWVFRGLEIITYSYLFSKFSLDLFSGSAQVIIWIFAFIIWDLSFYWLHRLHHRFSFFWKVHQVHHQGEHFNLSLGVRNSWYSSLTSIPFFIPMAIIGFPPEIFISVGAIHYFIQFYNHNRIIRNSGWLDHLMITPSHHRVHHGIEELYINKNFGGTLVIWDKLFGTFQKERKDLKDQYGLKQFVHSSDIISLNNDPFTAEKGIPNQNNKIVFNELYLAVGAFLQFLLLLSFIANEGIWPFNKLLALFIIISFGTICLGKISTGNKIWTFINICISVILPLTFIFIFPSDLITHFLLMLYVFYSAIISFMVLKL